MSVKPVATADTGRQSIKDALRPFADAYWSLGRTGYLADPKGTALMYNVKDPHFLGPNIHHLGKLSAIFDAMVEEDGGSRL